MLSCLSPNVLKIGWFIPNINIFRIQISNILDSEKNVPWSWMVDLAIPGRTGSQAPSAPGGVFWMNQPIFWLVRFLKFLNFVWKFLRKIWKFLRKI